MFATGSGSETDDSVGQESLEGVTSANRPADGELVDGPSSIRNGLYGGANPGSSRDEDGRGSTFAVLPRVWWRATGMTRCLLTPFAWGTPLR